MFHPALTQAAQRRALAADLRSLGIDARGEHMQRIADETGGSITLPDLENGWGPVEVEVTVLGVSHSGDTLEMAIDNWVKAAERCCPIPTDEVAA